jgi:hypothetical protein
MTQNKQSNQTTMDQTIIIIHRKLESYESNKEHNRNCLPSSVLMKLLYGRESSHFHYQTSSFLLQ